MNGEYPELDSNILIVMKWDFANKSYDQMLYKHDTRLKGREDDEQMMRKNSFRVPS